MTISFQPKKVWSKLGQVSGRAIRKNSALALALSGLMLASAGLMADRSAYAAGGDAIEIKHQKWSFAGMFGYFDRAQLQRGYKVYKEVCAACHSMNLMSYRNLSQKGGPEFSPEAVAVLAKEAEVTDGPNDDGEMFTRPGKPSDRMVGPYQNDAEARAANNGAFPPDLSVITKARGVHKARPFYLAPVHWVIDIAKGYEEAGADYLYALLVGYKDAPAGFELADGMNYNAAFAGHQIAMPAPLSDELVEYTDGTPQTVEQYARDVTAFFAWASDTKLEERKQLGFRVMIYLLILTMLLYLAKRKVWARIKH